MTYNRPEQQWLGILLAIGVVIGVPSLAVYWLGKWWGWWP
jgi:hypothetical protein